MVSFTTIATLFMATAAMAAPAANPAAEVVQVLARQQATCSGSVAAGTFQCGDVQGGCKSCAIVTGNSAGQCQVSSLCRSADNSCQTVNGQPFCE